jgi:hypothetical protein
MVRIRIPLDGEEHPEEQPTATDSNSGADPRWPPLRDSAGPAGTNATAAATIFVPPMPPAPEQHEETDADADMDADFTLLGQEDDLVLED